MRTTATGTPAFQPGDKVIISYLTGGPLTATVVQYPAPPMRDWPRPRPDWVLVTADCDFGPYEFEALASRCTITAPAEPQAV